MQWIVLRVTLNQLTAPGIIRVSGLGMAPTIRFGVG